MKINKTLQRGELEFLMLIKGYIAVPKSFIRFAQFIDDDMRRIVRSQTTVEDEATRYFSTSLNNAEYSGATTFGISSLGLMTLSVLDFALLLW
jgi:hypothetical protein